MANWFVRSLATGTGAGTSWTNATTTIAAAITLSAAGDTFYIADDHAETGTASLTLTFKGSATARDTILCADHTVTTPTGADLKTTATVTTTGTTAPITVNGYFYMYGVKFSVGTSTSAQKLNQATGALAFQHYDSCRFAIPSTGAANITVGSTGGKVRWTNCVISFGSASTNINPAGGVFEWLDTASAVDTGAVVPTSLLVPSGTITVIRLEGVDISALSTSTFFTNLANGNSVQLLLKDCKIGAAVTPATSFNWLGPRIEIIRCDSGNVNYRNELHQWMGSLTTETTIVRTGGATDGTTGFSHKIVSNSVCLWSSPFDVFPIAVWNDAVGSSKTITVEGIASAVPNNDEVWMEVEYLGSTTTPQGSRASTRKATFITTAAANTTSTSTWGGALTGKFKMAVTITPQQKGPITVYVKVAKASTTVYIDPYITVT